MLVLGKVLWVGGGQQVSAGSGEGSVGWRRPTDQCWFWGRFCGSEEANRSVLVLGKVLWIGGGQQVSAGSGEGSVGWRRPTGQCWLWGRFCGSEEANRLVLALGRIPWVEEKNNDYVQVCCSVYVKTCSHLPTTNQSPSALKIGCHGNI